MISSCSQSDDSQTKPLKQKSYHSSKRFEMGECYDLPYLHPPRKTVSVEAFYKDSNVELTGYECPYLPE